MVGARNVVQSMDGSKMSGDVGPLSMRDRNSLSIANSIPVLQAAHSLRTTAETGSPRKRPCTKGVANASSAQAPKIDSPESNITRCGVSSDVTGNAQLM